MHASPSSESNLRKQSSIKSALERRQKQKAIEQLLEADECYSFNSAVKANIIKHTNRIACAATEPGVRLSRQKNSIRRKKRR